jgi:hypothetical protein
MNDLGIEELKQLLTFYKQKSSELEFTLLQSELKINKLNAFKTQVEEAEKIKTEIESIVYEDRTTKRIKSGYVPTNKEVVNKTEKENKAKKSFFNRKSKNKTKG